MESLPNRFELRSFSNNYQGLNKKHSKKDTYDCKATGTFISEELARLTITSLATLLVRGALSPSRFIKIGITC